MPARLDPKDAVSLDGLTGVSASESVGLKSEPVPDIPGLAANLGGLTGEPQRLAQLAGVSATQKELAPEAEAGVKLAKIVLAIVTGSIVILVVYLFIVDIIDGTRTSAVYDQVMKQSGVGVEYSDPGSIEKGVEIVRQGIDKPEYVLNSVDAQSEQSLVDTLIRFKMLTDSQKNMMEKCVPFPTTSDRNVILQSCVDLMLLEEKAARGAAANIDKLRLMIEFSKDVDARHQGIYAFWMQMAQLILLNLLLPLLTGLFGYIFGTRQDREGQAAK